MKAFKTEKLGFVTFNAISRIEILERGLIIHMHGFGQMGIDSFENDDEENKEKIINILLHFEMIQKGEFSSLHDDKNIIPEKLKEFLGIVKRPVVGTDD